MPKNQDNLRDTLKQLHEQLQAAEPMSPEIRELLGEIIEDIHVLLEKQQGSQESIVRRLRAATEHFEGSHPVLFGTLGRLMDMLSQMGI